MSDQIDAVSIATPDHMHFPIAMAAIARLSMYVEKPIAAACRVRNRTRPGRRGRYANGQPGRAGEVSASPANGQAGSSAGAIRCTPDRRPRLPWFRPADFDPDANATDTPVPPTLD